MNHRSIVFVTTGIYPSFFLEPHARVGTIQTAHGEIKTPAFVFCATKGAIKAAWPHMARDTNTQIILSNTYHLLVHPGSKLIHDLGGLQRITNWNGPMMTDSGGYQIFSLGYGSVSAELKGTRSSAKSLVKIKEEGARFKSYKNGDTIFLTPELAMQAQIDFGADLVFVLDECTAFHIKPQDTENSMYRSHRWSKRSVEYFMQHKKSHQGVYGIVQGGIYENLRKKSIEFLSELDQMGPNSENGIFGVGIGGSLGKDLTDMERVIDLVCSEIEKYPNLRHKPRHLLGIGTIDAILMALPYGIDTFDCVYPTRLARHGGALIGPEHDEGAKRYLNLKNAKYERDERPIDEKCACYACKSFSRAYLHMMLKADESLALMAITEHNIAFMNNFMALIRHALNSSKLAEFRVNWMRTEKNDQC